MGAATGRSALARLMCSRGLLSEEAALKPVKAWCRALCNADDPEERTWMHMFGVFLMTSTSLAKLQTSGLQTTY